MKRALAFALVLCTLLTSCSSMLEREYTLSTPHEENQLHREDSYTVETYPALLNALDSYVEAGVLEGTLRFPTTYRGNLTVDLEKARRQLLEEDPLGNYALENVAYSVSKIIAYYEAELTFSYRVDRASLSSLPKLSTREALEKTLAQTLLNFEEEQVCLLVNYQEEDPGYFTSALRSAYDSVPAAALGLPELTVELYPRSGTRRVAVFRLKYAQTQSSLLRDRTRTELAGQRLMTGVEQSPEALLKVLQKACVYDPAAGSTAFNALLDRRANAEGMALGYALLLQMASVSARVEWQEGKPLVAISSGEDTILVDVTESLADPAELLP